MASFPKKVLRKSGDCNESHVSLSNDDDVLDMQDIIDLHFEGFNPSDSDFHGIKILLQQLFRKAHVDLSELTNLIISQNYVGSVVKEALDMDENDDDDDNDDDDNLNQVYGITTVINVTSKQNVPCIQQLRDLLKQLAEEHATDTDNAMIKNVLENDATHLGLLINERFVNIPWQISVPLFANLISEIKRAKNKNIPSNFSHYLLICKLYKPKKKKNKNMPSRNNAVEEPSVLWSNPEEEIFAEEAVADFEFCIRKEADTALFGKWTETDCEMIPYRRVLLFEASKLQTILNKIQSNCS